MYSRSNFLYWALSETFSAIISNAPFNASSTVKISFSSLMNVAAFASTSSEVHANKNSANGSKPASFAIVAFVRFFCLNGR